MNGLDGVVCGEAGNAEEILEQVQNHEWDLVIRDINMPGRSGIEFSGNPTVTTRLPALVLNNHAEDQYGKSVWRMGASGFMNKNVAPEE